MFIKILLTTVLTAVFSSQMVLAADLTKAKSDLVASGKSFDEKYRSITVQIKNGSFKEAKAELDSLKTVSSSERASKFFLSGLLLTKLGRFKEAIVANENAIANNPELLDPVFNIACIHALQGNKESALFYLEKLEGLAKKRKAREKYASLLKTDSDLASIKNEPNFKLLIEKFEENESGKGQNMKLFQKLADANPGVSVAEVAFIDKSFRKNGARNDPALGDYSEGLVGVLKIVPHIVISKNKTHFLVSFGASSWDFAVSIDQKTGAWLNPVVGSVVEESAPGPGPGPEN